MPILEFQCKQGHITEKLFLTFAEADKVSHTECRECLKTYKVNQSRPMAQRIISLPGQAILYGQGFYKPAASGNNSYRRSDPSKAAKELGQGQGLKGLEKTVNE